MKTKFLFLGLALAACGLAKANEQKAEDPVYDLIHEPSFLAEGSLRTTSKETAPMQTEISWKCSENNDEYNCEVQLKRFKKRYFDFVFHKAPARTTIAMAKVTAMFKGLLVEQGATKITVTPNKGWHESKALLEAGFKQSSGNSFTYYPPKPIQGDTPIFVRIKNSLSSFFGKE